MDLNQTRYETFEDLQVFCYRVASVVGLMMCWVIGFENPEDREKATPYAIDLGIALQLLIFCATLGKISGVSESTFLAKICVASTTPRTIYGPPADA